MVNSALLEQVKQLDQSQLLELRDAIDAELDDHVSAQVLAEIDRRLAAKGSRPDPKAVQADEFMRRVRTRRSA